MFGFDLFCSAVLFCSVLTWSDLLCSILSCSVLICLVLFTIVWFWSVLFRRFVLFRSDLIWSALFHSELFCSVLFCLVLLTIVWFWSVLFRRFVLFCSVLTWSDLFRSDLIWSDLLCSVLIWSDLICSVGIGVYVFLKSLRDENLLNETMLTLAGDHGWKFGLFRETIQGKLEERLPVLAIYFPSWCWDDERLSMKHRYFKLTFWYPCYAPTPHVPVTEPPPFNNRANGISFLPPHPKNRTCAKSNISEQCSVLAWYGSQSLFRPLPPPPPVR